MAPVSSVDAQILLREAYEIAYEIYDHEHGPENRPLALVALHPKEEYAETSRLYQTIRRYKIYDIHKHFGLSLTEFLELPRELTEFCFQVISEEAQNDNPRLDRELSELEDKARGK